MYLIFVLGDLVIGNFLTILMDFEQLTIGVKIVVIPFDTNEMTRKKESHLYNGKPQY